MLSSYNLFSIATMLQFHIIKTFQFLNLCLSVSWGVLENLKKTYKKLEVWNKVWKSKLPPGKIRQTCAEASSMAMNGSRENSLLARQTEAIRQMLTLNQVSSVCILITNNLQYILRIVFNWSIMLKWLSWFGKVCMSDLPYLRLQYVCII